MASLYFEEQNDHHLTTNGERYSVFSEYDASSKPGATLGMHLGPRFLQGGLLDHTRG